MTYEKAVEVNIPDGGWHSSGQDEDPTARLIVAVHVNGVPHHLEAYAVEVKEHVQVVIDQTFESNYEGICMASEPNGRYQTTKILGRDYVLVMTPYC